MIVTENKIQYIVVIDTEKEIQILLLTLNLASNQSGTDQKSEMLTITGKV